MGKFRSCAEAYASGSNGTTEQLHRASASNRLLGRSAASAHDVQLRAMSRIDLRLAQILAFCHKRGLLRNLVSVISNKC
jgi:hypothetical protein